MILGPCGLSHPRVLQATARVSGPPEMVNLEILVRSTGPPRVIPVVIPSLVAGRNGGGGWLARLKIVPR
jgi:hypothetical protein